jgi:hypothetical protein
VGFCAPALTRDRVEIAKARNNKGSRFTCDLSIRK